MSTRYVFFVFVLFAQVARGQADRPLDGATLRNDTLIFNEMIKPTLSTARGQHQELDWKILGATIMARFDASYVDRNVTKAKIYYFYGVDWAQFTACIVHYTNRYEWKDDLPLMNKNARMILDHSQKAEELKAAQGWVKNAVDKAPGEEKYKATYDALTEKIGK